MKRDRRSEKVYLPSSHDIQEACERIQKGWSERERLKRSGGDERWRWLPPVVECESLYPDGYTRTSDMQFG